jgi:hypothetical protein
VRLESNAKSARTELVPFELLDGHLAGNPCVSVRFADVARGVRDGEREREADPLRNRVCGFDGSDLENITQCSPVETGNSWPLSDCLYNGVIWHGVRLILEIKKRYKLLTMVAVWDRPCWKGAHTFSDNKHDTGLEAGFSRDIPTLVLAGPPSR